jgi:prepilin-type N-terminal cleavage/methylation domain-containing protein
MRRAERGFTLLEVMAAVAVLGLVYTVLGRAGIQGLQHEGEAERRIAASLLADQVLEEIEAGLEAGVVPRLGEEEREVGEFAVAITVQPYDLLLPEPEETAPGATGERGPRRPGQSLRDEEADLGPSLLVGARGDPSPLRRIDVRVIWVEGFGERSVERTSFGLDAQAAQESLAALDAAAEASSPGHEETPQPPETPR